MKFKSILFGIIIYCIFSLSSVVMKLASLHEVFIYKILLSNNRLAASRLDITQNKA